MIQLGKYPACMSKAEVEQYVKIFTDLHPFERDGTLNIMLDGDYVDLYLDAPPVKFQRIRRITGYLVGDLSRFNNAKRQEVADRVKHTNVD